MSFKWTSEKGSAYGPTDEGTRTIQTWMDMVGHSWYMAHGTSNICMYGPHLPASVIEQHVGWWIKECLNKQNDNFSNGSEAVHIQLRWLPGLMGWTLSNLAHLVNGANRSHIQWTVHKLGQDPNHSQNIYAFLTIGMSGMWQIARLISISPPHADIHVLGWEIKPGTNHGLKLWKPKPSALWVWTTFCLGCLSYKAFCFACGSSYK